MIDLRSDTVTRPTAAMRQAMAAAEVGDDVLGDDPTVAKLEQATAEILGKEAAVYMPSGTMTNQVAVRAHTEPGDEILLDANAHVYYYEAGAPAALSGVMCRLLAGVRGIFTGRDVRDALRPRNLHFPRTKLVCIENTHNRGGGSVWTLEQIADVHAVARDAGLKLHLDGARIWNAAVALGVREQEIARWFDSVSVCFSKGLGAPVGSVLAGTSEFIERARRFRKQFGGGMRQAGIIAAGALYALEHHRERLRTDHENARWFAEQIAGIPGIQLDPTTVQTNIIVFDVTSMPAEAFGRALQEAGVLVLARGASEVRAVTHLDVTRKQIEQAVEIIRKILQQRSVMNAAPDA
ncbi:MAG TPA: low-specificity L-threonine aldolase [Phycisphaerae bacterium]|nr:low-specificity L-threonine aldolase [Phycisphaerae bacterium]HOJ73781.1 low-specificity L-threonine aldolase [Phycisphaerae bacterium]HOM50428.1 low-specificity L-threonine aldolase [Phycisphaerae bacterium]HPP28128.1 low-specificity L-threonine aldolase [Phycisphaerae bacterium]HPU26755.1 low-specificity L-threonine aldolase [Phycisphaerae bacterium]